jgi:hypothetical protein
MPGRYVDTPTTAGGSGPVKTRTKIQAPCSHVAKGTNYLLPHEISGLPGE